MLIKWLEKSIERFNRVVTEGNYRMPPMTWGRLIRGLKPQLQLPATSEVAVGTSMIDTGKMLGERFLWAFSIAALGAVALKWAAIGFGLAGVGVYTLEYFRAKKSREDVINEINFAGQRVQGTRADLYRLHHAQLRIMNISNSMNAESSSTADAIDAILDSVKEERTRVQVLDEGRHNAGMAGYGFTEPDFRLMHTQTAEEKKKKPRKPRAKPAAKTEVKVEPVAVEKPALESLDLKAAWDSKRMTSDDFVERLAELQEALPAEMQEKLKQRLSRTPSPTTPATPA